ncbi:hypothetical protein VNO77_36924 [Canavalia gladiata]|uniref:Uncharacterized protein n=1 Tax=Canavalia gladiata TaxID=3824 RepID=A0AAN9K9S1_CANGL
MTIILSVAIVDCRNESQLPEKRKDSIILQLADNLLHERVRKTQVNTLGCLSFLFCLRDKKGVGPSCCLVLSFNFARLLFYSFQFYSFGFRSIIHDFSFGSLGYVIE